jgi:NAD(P)-dependent dehydrogenase (short-subunit alcohol dehydrogenase family)
MPASTGTWAGIDELAVQEFRSTLDINLVGTFITIKYAVPHLRRRGGSVIVTSSVNGTRIFSNSGATAYSASKAGQVALAKMLAVELGPDKIRVNVICPGAISTEISDNTNAENADVKIPVEYPEGNIPLTGGQPGSAEQVGELIAFLASHEATHISGSTQSPPGPYIVHACNPHAQVHT